MSLDRLIAFFSSLRLTVVCLGIGAVLVFVGTLAQVDLGLYKAQNDFFRSFFVYWSPRNSTLRIPVFPGGYLVGGLLFVNLITAHIKRFKFSKKKIGIWLTHVGIILLILGQLLTDLLSNESVMHLREGEAKNYSEVEREAELAIIEANAADTHKVVAIPQDILTRQKEVSHPELPVKVIVKQFFRNSDLKDLAEIPKAQPAAEKGAGARYSVQQLPNVTDMEKRDVPSAIVELVSNQGSLGTWLVSEWLRPQEVTINKQRYNMVLRPQRNYKPFTVQLLDFKHDLYPGTDTPKNFSSRIILNRPEANERREVLIYMNSPLRYAGETFYQASFDKDDGGTVLQVVHNPSWLTPYASCLLVALGLIVQFMTHLLGFALKRRNA